MWSSSVWTRCAEGWKRGPGWCRDLSGWARQCDHRPAPLARLLQSTFSFERRQEGMGMWSWNKQNANAVFQPYLCWTETRSLPFSDCSCSIVFCTSFCLLETSFMWNKATFSSSCEQIIQGNVFVLLLQTSIPPPSIKCHWFLIRVTGSRSQQPVQSPQINCRSTWKNKPHFICSWNLLVNNKTNNLHMRHVKASSCSWRYGWILLLYDDMCLTDECSSVNS